MVSSYLNLTKPTISLLVTITALAAFVVEGSLLDSPLKMWTLVFAIFLTAGSANSFNQYFERDVDKKMARTSKKRPLPLGQISANSALVFSFLIGVIGVVFLYIWGGLLASALGLATILFYSLYYTLYLKPRTPYNIVIGGAAGAMGPIIAWACVSGQISMAAWIMFAIIFFWTPPHFWALALCLKKDYEAVSYPMLPNVAGDDATRKQILYYSYSLLPLCLILYFIGDFGFVYLSGSIFLNILFVAGAILLYRKKTISVYWKFFAFSIFYVLLLFGLMIADVFISH